MVRISKRVLKNIRLPEETKQFLNQGGVAEMIGYGVIMPTLPRLTELVSETGSLPASFARYRVLGEVGCLMYGCLDEEENGQVVAVLTGPEQENAVLFANSSILHYAECCIVTDDLWDMEIEQGCAGERKEALQKYIAKYEQAIREIDPPALADNRTWYARQVRNMKAEWSI